jgi:CRISPR-associated protein Cmr1
VHKIGLFINKAGIFEAVCLEERIVRRLHEYLTVTFKVVTPLFLGGADPQQAEVRLSSIKGCLRYWYRAINAAYNEPVDRENKNGVTQEEWLFGGSEKGVGRFLMRDVTEKVRIEEYQGDSRRRGYRGYRSGKFDSLKYITFPFRSGGRKYIAENQEIKIQFFMRPGLSQKEKEDSWRELMSTIWLLGHIGGLGSRSRRGFGTVALHSWEVNEKASEDFRNIIDKIKDKLKIAHSSSIKTSKEWIEEFSSSLKMVRNWFEGYEGSPHTVINRESSFYLNTKGSDDWEQAMGKGAACLEKFRTQKGLGLGRVALGLPMIIPKGPQFVPVDYNRVASPVLLRVIGIGRKYYPLFAVLSAPFPEKIEEKEKGRTNKTHTIKYQTVINAFKQHLLDRGYKQGGTR